MGEDGNRARQGDSAQNLAVMRKLALNLLRQAPSGKGGITATQQRAGGPGLLAQNSVTNVMRLPCNCSESRANRRNRAAQP
jgi:hypothetical protein